MVICPIALAVHCTGCPFVKFCPAKTFLGDYGKETIDQESKEKSKSERGTAGEAADDSGEAKAP